MKIRFSTPYDIPKIRHIMSAVFGDSSFYLDLLFKIKYDNNVVVCEIEGEVVASAFLLPSLMEQQPCTYVYGCATLPPFRGKGIMKQILDYSYQHVCSQNQCGLFLVPATEDLALYYKRLGYDPFFYHSEFHFELFDFKVSLEKKYTLEKMDFLEYFEFRSHFLTGQHAILWDSAHFELVEKEYARTKGGFFKILEKQNVVGIGFYYMMNFKTIISEFLGKITSLELANIFFNKIETNEIDVITVGDQSCFGMAKWNQGNLDFVGRNGYFAFALD